MCSSDLYQYYIEKFLNKDNEIELKDRQIRVFDKVLHEEDEDRVKLKKLARVLAQVSGQAVVMRFGEDSYSVGLTNLLRQPEFDDHELLLDVSQMLDEMSEAFNFELEEASGEPEILIGEENPFGQECTLIAGQYGLGADRGYIGVLGPRRMDYKTNYALIKKIMEMIG